MTKLQDDVTRTRQAYRNPRAIRPALIAGRGHAADPARLRLIPAIGPNAPGAIPGTRPDTNHRILRHARHHG